MKIVVGQRDDRATVTASVLHRLCELLDGIEQSREDYSGADAYMQWGFKLTKGLQWAIDHKIPYVIVDWGYFADRESCISISFNGFHGLSMPVRAVRQLPARWHPTPKPWRYSGTYVTVFGQLQNDRAVRGLAVDQWLRDTAVAAANAFELPAKIREHPKMRCAWDDPLPPLEKVLDETRIAVTYTSSVGILTCLAGVPTIALHPASPASMVCSDMLGEILTPVREGWLHDLSWRNYPLREMKEAANYVRLGLTEAVVPASIGDVDTEGLRV